MRIRITQVILLVFIFLLLLSSVGCQQKEVERQYLPVKWEYIIGLPEGFPKLCEAVTGASRTEDFPDTVSFLWNILDKEDFDGYLKTMEEWADAKFTEADGAYRLETFVPHDAGGGQDIKIEANYKAEATGDHIEGPLYDNQARVTVEVIPLRYR